MISFLRSTIIFVLCFISFINVDAQNSVKDMDKNTKAELKEYIKNPASYRKMIKGYKEQLEAYELELNEVKEDFYKADYLRVLYYDSIQELNAQLKAKENNLSASNTDEVIGINASNMYKNTGTEYRVQIGAYRLFDFTKLLQFNQPIGYEKIDGIIHYYLGSWTNANEAYEFAEAIRKLKIKDAFVSKYIDGNRVPYNHLTDGTVVTN